MAPLPAVLVPLLVAERDKPWEWSLCRPRDVLVGNKSESRLGIRDGSQSRSW